MSTFANVAARSRLEARATRYLARQALRDGALDPVSYDFICDAPQRADEVSEFTTWLAEVVS